MVYSTTKEVNAKQLGFVTYHSITLKKLFTIHIALRALCVIRGLNSIHVYGLFTKTNTCLL